MMKFSRFCLVLVYSCLYIGVLSSQTRTEIYQSIHTSIEGSGGDLDSLLNVADRLDFENEKLENSDLKLSISITTDLNQKRMYGQSKFFLRHITRQLQPEADQYMLWLHLLDQEVTAYGYSGQWDTCRQILEEGIKLIQIHDLNDSFPQFYSNMGYAKNMLGESPINEYLYALKLSEANGDLDVQISTLNNIARAYRAEQDILKSIEFSQRALKVAEKHGIPIGAHLIVNLAEVYAHNNELQKGLELYQNYESQIQNTPNAKRVFYFGLGEYYIFKLKNYEKGLYYSDLALKSRSQFRTSKLIANKAFVYALQRKYDLAIQWHIKAAEEYHQTTWPIPLGVNLLDLSKGSDQFWYMYRYAQILYLKNLNSDSIRLEEMKEAVARNKQAMDILYYFQSRLSIGEKSRYTEYIRKCTELAVEMDYLMYLEESDEEHLINMLQSADLAKSLESINQDKKHALGSKNDNLARLFDEEDQYMAELIDLKNRTSTTSQWTDSLNLIYLKKVQSLNEIKKDIAEEVPVLYGYAHDKVGLQSLRDKLNPDEVILYYFLANYTYNERSKGLYIMLISTDTILVYYNDKIADLKDQILSLSKGIVNQSDVLKPLTDTISNRLLRPVQPYIQGKHLIIISDKYLNQIPFEILTSTSSQYLIETNEIRYAPSVQILLRDYLGDDLQGVLALAPQTENSVIPLPGARDELSFLNSKYKGKFLVGSNATEAIFKQNAKEYGIVHLATHGILNDLYPEDSYLHFSEKGSIKEDGRLYVDEINYLKVPASLVVLGSCNSGAGKIFGDGVMSLAKSFVNAGSQNILCGLWSLDDQSTAILLKNFYSHLEKGQTPAAALRHAKINFVNSAPGNIKHPYYWAGMVLTGINDVPLLEHLVASDNIHNRDRWVVLWIIGLIGFGILIIWVLRRFVL